MPIFEFQCQACGRTFEVLERRSGPAGPPPCPACGAGETQRILSVFSGRAGERCSSPAGFG